MLALRTGAKSVEYFDISDLFFVGIVDVIRNCIPRLADGPLWVDCGRPPGYSSGGPKAQNTETAWPSNLSKPL